MAEKIIGLKSAIVDKLVETLGIQSAVDKIPVEMASKIQPVINIEPEGEQIIKYGSAGAGSNVTVYTTPTKETFYLTSVMFSPAAGGAHIDVSKNGATVDLIRSKTSSPITMNYSRPLKLDKNSDITLYAASGSAGNVTITGYIV